MNQQIQPLQVRVLDEEVVTPLAIQAQWLQYVVPTLMALGMVGSMLNSMLPTVKELFKK